MWDLLTRDFYWTIPADYPVMMYGGSEDRGGQARLQIFEIAVAAIFARLRPDYAWYVTPNRPDGGLDFVGVQEFLRDEALGIAAGITVGGQCKKRNTVNDIVGEVAGSLARMASTLNPTFFVVALSARLDADRVAKARQILERVHQRHCHILDRDQLEGLFSDHLGAVEEILRQALDDDEVVEILDYFAVAQRTGSSDVVETSVPNRVLAGAPFEVSVALRASLAISPTARLWWRGPTEVITLVGPVGADGVHGADVGRAGTADMLLHARKSLELVTYVVGDVELGEVLIGLEQRGPSAPVYRADLGTVRVVENLRPRFFERPARPGLIALSGAHERSLARGIASIGVTGAGGSGKSRLCEEFAIDRRRRGARVVSIKAGKSVDDPRRLLADMLSALVGPSAQPGRQAEHVLAAIAAYDNALAEGAETSVRSIFGLGSDADGTVDEQSILSSLIVLLVAGSRGQPVVVHLQDLHWCPADVLLLLGTLVWQIEQLLAASGVRGAAPETGILLIFEGRIRERYRDEQDGWDSQPFERFLDGLDSPTVLIDPFDPQDSLEFIRRLFEDRYSAARKVSRELAELQRQLVERVDRAAGGNPFHSLAQIELLKERGVLGQNPHTGLLYLIQPELGRLPFPRSVRDAIDLRWTDLKRRSPELALLIWGCGLLEDRIPVALFRRLWRELAPEASLDAIDRTGIIWTAGGEREVSFRHEHYFGAVRTYDVPPEERERVVMVYSDWFAGARPDPADLLRWVRATLELPEPDITQARKLLTRALAGARRIGDAELVQRVQAVSLDLSWRQDARSPLRPATFVRCCTDDLVLVRTLLHSDRTQAAERLHSSLARIDARLSGGRGRGVPTLEPLERLRLTGEVIRSQLLFNDRQPALAAEIAAAATGEIAQLATVATNEREEWAALTMEALHAHAVALALCGEIDEALATSARAVEMAAVSTAPLAHDVISTHANILLARDAQASEAILRRLLEELTTAGAHAAALHATEINLAMALTLRAYAARSSIADDLLVEARTRLLSVFQTTFRLGRYPDAAAAALMLGLVSLLAGEPGEAAWFAQSVAAAARGRQMETLWRAHINLATALHVEGDSAGASVHDHARAALEIMEETLAPYPQPDRSARFGLLRVPLAQSVRFLLLAGDASGPRALERYPRLRASFSDPVAGILGPDPGPRSHEWLRIDDEDYVIY